MYNLSVDEISMVDGGGDGAYSGSNTSGGHTTYGGQGNGFQASGQHGGSISGQDVACAGLGAAISFGTGGWGALAGAAVGLGCSNL
ncbi:MULTISPECIES: hypothetical protein [Vibrio]|uniref:Uncharacterized protein n=1 Tax=Vibrio casei TaxID=673372 RepID=A0A368LP15_9VIBR|nr:MULTISPECIES: hypothetical protein [Vibrio]RCS73649.1 hypothetical protein CIK83_08510 [Vibrio casei]SJN16577.1 hypothetical protein FM109_00690 [Vibrio casei]HBV75486.1 hypothetical protein [Vibrio sp.]